MLKLFLKNQVLFLLILIVMCGALYYYNQENNAYTMTYNVNLAARTLFDLSKQRLTQIPQNQWASYMQTLQPQNGFALKILPVTQLPVALQQNMTLRQGNLMNWQDQRNGEVVPAIYQRIDHTDLYFRLQIAPSLTETYQHNVAWLSTLLYQNLKDTPAKQWPLLLQNFSKQWEMPVFLMETHLLSEQQQQQLTQWHFAFEERDSGNVSTIWLPTPNSQQVVQIGPHVNKIISRDRLLFMALLAAILVMLISWLWTRPFYRALTRLNQLATRYGKGQFGKTELVITKGSSFYPLYQGMTDMAKKIEALIAAQKILTHTVAHELRTPLTRLRFITHRLANKIPDAQPYVSEINEEMHELAQLIDEMLTYVRFDHDGVKLHLTPKPINILLAELITEHQHHHPSKTWTLSDTSTTPVVLPFDEHYLKRALHNLLINAFHYGDSKIAVTLSVDRQHCILYIDDDGPGIAPADRERIFNVFERGTSTATPQHSGYGLGLSIAQRIVHLHSGTLTVDTAPLGGARFIITLPYAVGA